MQMESEKMFRKMKNFSECTKNRPKSKIFDRVKENKPT